MTLCGSPRTCPVSSSMVTVLFPVCVSFAHKLPAPGPFTLSPALQLDLYGLFKRATCGPASKVTAPSYLDFRFVWMHDWE